MGGGVGSGEAEPGCPHSAEDLPIMIVHSLRFVYGWAPTGVFLQLVAFDQAIVTACCPISPGAMWSWNCAGASKHRRTTPTNLLAQAECPEIIEGKHDGALNLKRSRTLEADCGSDEARPQHRQRLERSSADGGDTSASSSSSSSSVDNGESFVGLYLRLASESQDVTTLSCADGGGPRVVLWLQHLYGFARSARDAAPLTLYCIRLGFRPPLSDSAHDLLGSASSAAALAWLAALAMADPFALWLDLVPPRQLEASLVAAQGDLAAGQMGELLRLLLRRRGSVAGLLGKVELVLSLLGRTGLQGQWAARALESGAGGGGGAEGGTSAPGLDEVPLLELCGDLLREGRWRVAIVLLHGLHVDGVPTPSQDQWLAVRQRSPDSLFWTSTLFDRVFRRCDAPSPAFDDVRSLFSRAPSGPADVPSLMDLHDDADSLRCAHVCLTQGRFPLWAHWAIPARSSVR